jgi:hypothetical protein
MSRRRVTAPVRVGDVLIAAVPELADRMLEETIRKEWRLTAGADLARRSRPAELRAGTLTVVVDNSPWLQELTMRSEPLLRALQSRYGAAVRALRFALGEVGRRPEPAARPRSEPEPELTDEEAGQVEAVSAPLRDPKLAAALRRLLTKDMIARRQARPAGPGSRREDS